MNIDVNKVLITTTVPLEEMEKLRVAICNAGAGIIGNYSHCTLTNKCKGTFIPLDSANPYIGENNKLEIVDEYKIETICDISKAKNVIQKIRETHPYEEPMINVIPLINEEDL